LAVRRRARPRRTRAAARRRRRAGEAPSPAFGRRAAVAQAVDLQRAALGHEAVGAADLRLQGVDARADELDDAAAGAADEVVVLLAGVEVLVDEATLSEAALADEAAGDHQLEVAVHRGPRHLGAARLQR